MSFYPRYATVVILLATLPLGGCLFRTHRIDQTSSPVPLKAATKPELVAYMNSQAAKIQSMQATVDIDTAVGGAKKGRVTEYQQIRGYVLARKPAMLLREIDRRDETAVLENGVETVTDDKGRKLEQADYVIDVIRSHGNDSWLSRKIVFSRVDLLPNRQLI